MCTYRMHTLDVECKFKLDKSYFKATNGVSENYHTPFENCK